MKARKSVLLVVVMALIMTLLATPGPAVAQASKTEFLGSSSTIGIIPGDWTTLPSGNIKVRGMTLVFQDDMSDPRASGTNTVVMNANWDSDATGPMWGTFEVVNKYGAWEGSWTGEWTADGSIIRGVAQGTGGLAGLKYSIACDYTVDPSACNGQILSPHGD
jgi:hypothetical protein